jgi:hypothetical protein
MKQARDYLVEAYLDYANNYLTIEKYAEHNGLTKEQADEFISLAYQVYTTRHPDA